MYFVGVVIQHRFSLHVKNIDVALSETNVDRVNDDGHMIFNCSEGDIWGDQIFV